VLSIFFKVVDPVLFVFESHVLYSRDALVGHYFIFMLLFGATSPSGAGPPHS